LTRTSSGTISLSKGATDAKKPTRFLISQAYSTYNKGEVAIVISIIETIRRLCSNAEISIMTPAPEQAEKHYSKYGAKVYPRLLNSSSSSKGVHRVIGYSKLAFKAFSYLACANINKNIHMDNAGRIAFDLFFNADLVIIAGGGTFGGSKYRSLSGNLFPIYLAKKLGKRVIVYGPSVEPFTSKPVKMATRFVFNRADIITVRESLTFELLKSLKLKTRFYLTADPAFLIGNDPLDKGIALLRKAGVATNSKLLVGITIRDWNFPKEVNSATKRTQYLDAIRQTIQNILETKDDAIIVIFTTSINIPFNDDDRVIARQIKASIKDTVRNRVIILTRDYTPHQIKSMIGNMDVFIATRFHSAVFALSMNIPLMMVATEPHKNRGIMEMMNLAEYTLDASEVTSDALFATFNKLIDNQHSIAEQIAERLPLIKAQSMKNGQFLEELLNQTR
jgi:polysaccharide pyruvyl transferase WcaK-like protein